MRRARGLRAQVPIRARSGLRTPSVGTRERDRLPRDSETAACATANIVNIDVTAYIDGMHGDTSATFAVGGYDTLDEPTRALIDTTREATLAGIAAVAPGRQLRDIGRVVETLASARGYGVVRDYGGHGIGRYPDPPHVFTRRGLGSSDTVPGSAHGRNVPTGGAHTLTMGRGWTARPDGLPIEQFDNTVIATEEGVSHDNQCRWPGRHNCLARLTFRRCLVPSARPWRTHSDVPRGQRRRTDVARPLWEGAPKCDVTKTWTRPALWHDVLPPRSLRRCRPIDSRSYFFVSARPTSLSWLLRRRSRRYANLWVAFPIEASSTPVWNLDTETRVGARYRSSNGATSTM